MLKKLLTLLFLTSKCFAQSSITFGNDKLTLTLDYHKTANISRLVVNGETVSENVYSMIRTKTATYSTLHLDADPVVRKSGNIIRVTGIKYGPGISETWTFTITASEVKFDVARTVAKAISVEKIASPCFMFNSINTWEGAYQDYGGVAWFYLFNKRRDTYGVYSNTSEFWNSKTGNGLTVSVSAPGKHVAMDYSRTMDDKLAYSIAVSPSPMQLRFDADTKRRRYTRDTTDVWAAFGNGAGSSTEHITLSYFDFKEKYGRGRLVGINQDQVSSVLNTILRIGVIGKKHFGGNSWHTPYGPICLHEQYIAQMGLGINDKKYLKGYQDCLDFYRDNAIKPDGRVWPRWAYTNEDAMPKAYTDEGFYEAQWGYLLDSNPDYVIDVSELYDQTGDLSWVRTQQQACEKALDWIVKRDENKNGLVEMMTDSYKQKRGSDWIDIIWAAYENAFVNAKLYRALVLWADIEAQLGNATRKATYERVAERLKASFNKPISEGGFWDVEHKCYVHWRDKDGSIHGTNMVTPVNFMAIAYNICDDADRTKQILDGIETQMVKENLFFWPLCMYSYAPGEGNDWQFPFPNYENGDIFLSWGSVAVKAYASYKPELAVKYVKNVLKQYSIDGLAFQRYGRAKQDGRGDDILSGNGLSVVGLYQAIYGINPLHNRFYLDPHITQELAGTQVKYNYRNQRLTIDLDMNSYAVSNDRFKIMAKTDFGFYSSGNELSYFNGSAATASLKATAVGKLALDILQWGADEIVFTAQGKAAYSVSGLTPGKSYSLNTSGKKIQSSAQGTLTFEAGGGKIILKQL
ncbi:MAG: hypothetical protein JST68_17305 [Bacteroidetes bacterium]|nr:hypothetical protein [Bacteroidota bacterium]